MYTTIKHSEPENRGQAKSFASPNIRNKDQGYQMVNFRNLLPETNFLANLWPI